MTHADTIKTLQAALRAAQTHQDRDLRPEALHTKRQAMKAAALAAAHEGVDPYTAQTTSAAEAARLGARGALTGGDATRLVAREQTWRRLLPLLESGRPLKSLIATADPLTLEAIAEWAPTWVRSQTPYPTDGISALHFEEPDVSWIEASVFSRMAEVSDDKETFAVVASSDADAATSAAYAAILAEVENGSPFSGQTLNALRESDPGGYAALMGREA